MIRMIRRAFCIGILAMICVPVMAQDYDVPTITISGKVLEMEDDTPLKAVTIRAYVGDGVVLARTDSTGSFAIDVRDDNLPLEISYPGYKLIYYYPIEGSDQKIRLTKEGASLVKKSFNVVSSPNELHLVNGAINLSEISNIREISHETVDFAIQNESGVYAERRSGMPGLGTNMFIRGVGSIQTLNAPLIIVDGMILGNYNFGNSALGSHDFHNFIAVNPNDIESVVVLKDAVSVGIYGTKGSNGVVVINTKKTYTGETEVGVLASIGMRLSPEQIPMLNGQEHRAYLQSQLFSQGLTATEINQQFPFLGNEQLSNPAYEYNTNWQDEIFQPGRLVNGHVTLKGGDEAAKFHVSVGYTGFDGVVRNSSYDRINTRINTSIKINKWLSVDGGLGFAYTTGNIFDQGPDSTFIPVSNPVNAALYKSPLTGVFETVEEGANAGDLTDRLSDSDLLGASNPVALIEDSFAEKINYSLIGNYRFNIDFNGDIDGFVDLGVELNSNTEHFFLPMVGTSQQAGSEAENVVRFKVDKYLGIMTGSGLTYTYRNGGHNVSAILGTRWSFTNNVQDFSRGINTGSDEFRAIQFVQEDSRRKDGYSLNYIWINNYVKVNYNYKNTFFLDFSVAMDGSSRFGDEAEGGVSLGGKSFGVFPAIGGGVDLANLLFVNNPNINLLKLRASAGIVGNDFFGEFLARDYYVASQYFNVTGLARGGLINEGAKWEEHETINVGLTGGFLRERIFVSMDAFQTNVKDMLAIENLSDVFGFESVISNTGTSEKMGIEATVDAKILTGKLGWRTSASFTTYKSELTSLPNNEIIDMIGAQKINRVGEAPGVFYGLKTNGIFSTTEQAQAANLTDQFGQSYEAGDVHFVDINGDNVIDSRDRQIIGDPNPDFFGRVQNTISYGGFSVMAEVRFVIGRDVFNYQRSQIESVSSYNNQSRAVLGRWQEEGDVATIPRLNFNDPLGNNQFSDRWIEDGSFIKLSRVQLTYDFNSVGTFSGLQVFVVGENLFSLDDYLGFDPEFSYGYGYRFSGVDYGVTPYTPSFLVGVKAQL